MNWVLYKKLQNLIRFCVENFKYCVNKKVSRQDYYFNSPINNKMIFQEFITIILEAQITKRTENQKYGTLTNIQKRICGLVDVLFTAHTPPRRTFTIMKRSINPTSITLSQFNIFIYGRIMNFKDLSQSLLWQFIEKFNPVATWSTDDHVFFRILRYLTKRSIEKT